MIKNERQYKVSRAQHAKFQQALRDFDATSSKRNVQPAMLRLERAALEGQAETLAAEIAQFEALRDRSEPFIEAESLEDLPALLIKARIASGLSQRDLAERLGLKEQQVQQYEASDYSGASMTRIIQIGRTMGIAFEVPARLSVAGLGEGQDADSYDETSTAE